MSPLDRLLYRLGLKKPAKPEGIRVSCGGLDVPVDDVEYVGIRRGVHVWRARTEVPLSQFIHGHQVHLRVAALPGHTKLILEGDHL